LLSVFCLGFSFLCDSRVFGVVVVAMWSPSPTTYTSTDLQNADVDNLIAQRVIAQRRWLRVRFS
jgi:hypothetical protein